ncbi:hypothetical protein D3C84_393540 [compost metagenome]
MGHADLRKCDASLFSNTADIELKGKFFYCRHIKIVMQRLPNIVDILWRQQRRCTTPKKNRPDRDSFIINQSRLVFDFAYQRFGVPIDIFFVFV